MDSVRAALAAIYNVIEFDAATITTYSPKTETAQIVGMATPGITRHPLTTSTDYSMDPSLFGGGPVYRSEGDRKFVVDEMLLDAGLRSRLSLPIVVDDQPLGMLNMGSKTPHKLEPPHLFTEHVTALASSALVAVSVAGAETLARLVTAISSREQRDTMDRVLRHLADGFDDPENPPLRLHVRGRDY